MGLWAAASGRRHSGTLGSRGGGRAGMADVDGGGARRDDGARGRWDRAAGLCAATSTAAVLGDIGLAWWGEQGTVAAPGADQETKCLGEGRRRKEIYLGGFCPGWSHDPGVAPPETKGVFGRAGKIPSPRPIFSPGWIYHPGQKGPVSLVPAKSYVCFCLFLLFF